MGQQQLLLILLVTIIVAFATIIAINTMQDSHQSANHDAIRLKMIEASSLAQSYYRKNKMMGGGGGSYEEITLQDLEIEPNDENLGNFSLSEESSDSFKLTAVPARGGEDIVSVIYTDRIEFVDED